MTNQVDLEQNKRNKGATGVKQISFVSKFLSIEILGGMILAAMVLITTNAFLLD